MAHAHTLATDATTRGLWVAALGILLVLLLSVGFAMRLRAAVLTPLADITAAARAFADGDFGTAARDPDRPKIQGELAELADAFEHVRQELAARETKLVHNERVAAIGQLAAGVAHEINNPIGIIRGYLRTMSPDADAETLREELGILDEEAGRCERIAADLLAYARSDDLEP